MGDFVILKPRPPIGNRPGAGKQLRFNDFIRSPQVRLIDENENQAGVVELNEAKRRAREAGLDLVEVAPMATPPVCRIMDYGKWKYQQKKKEQKARSHAKTSELKEIRLRPKIDDHDLEVKMQRAREFLTDGDKVQFTMIFRGREMAHRDIGIASLQKIKNDLVMVSKVESEPRMMGKRMTMVLAPDKKSGAVAPKPPAPASAPGITPGSSTPGTSTSGTSTPGTAPGTTSGTTPGAMKPASAPRPVATSVPTPTADPK